MSLVPYSKEIARRATRAALGKSVAAGLGLAGTYVAYDQMMKKKELSPNEITLRESIAAEKARQEQLETLIDAKITKSNGNEGQLYENLYTDLINLPVAEILRPPGINMQIEAYALDRMRKKGEEDANLKRIEEGLKPNPVAELTPIRSINDIMTIINNYISYLYNKKTWVGKLIGYSYSNEFNPKVLRQKISYKQTNADIAAKAAASKAELRGGRRKRTRRRRTHRRSRSNRK